MKDRVPIAQLLQEALAADRLRRRAAGRVPRPAETGQFEQAGRAGAAASTSRACSRLDDFITQLAEFIARQPDEPLAATQPENVDVVRLMSIHQAKGLEFPVVVVPDLDRPRLRTDGAVAFTPRLGPMVGPAARPSAATICIALSQSDEEQAELVRLLYVATTRAADYLILSAGLAAPELGRRARGRS